MLNKLKDILGIEGVKIILELNEKSSITPGVIKGKLVFTSQSTRHIEKIEIKLIEKYKRGRNDAKLINNYLLGSLKLDVDFNIERGETKSIAFNLPYNLMKSEMDVMEDESFLTKPFYLLAKKLKNVSSDYRLEATAIITGTKFHPIIEEKIEL